jgi:hypothetical protein
MDIPTGLVFLLGILALLGWLVVEWRSGGRFRFARIGLALLGIVATNVGSAHSQSGPLWIHRGLLTAIDRELQEGDASRVRQAVRAYNGSFYPKHDFLHAALSASEVLQEAESARFKERAGPSPPADQ